MSLAVRAALLLLVFALGGCTAGKKTSIVRVEATGREPREIYEHGQKMMRQGNWDKAVADFTELRNYHRDDPLSVRAQLSLGEISFRKREYEEARYTFEEFATYHPRHPDLDYVTYMIGLSLWRQTPVLIGRDQTITRLAVNRLSGFATRFPDSPYRSGDKVQGPRTPGAEQIVQAGVDRLARKELTVARFYERREAWAGVMGRAEEVVQRYPTSTLAEEALAMLAKAYHATGRTDDAAAARARLVEGWPASRYVAEVDRALAKPSGVPPEDAVFARPYRRQGIGQQIPAMQ